jgi:hypothetical protein
MRDKLTLTENFWGHLQDLSEDLCYISRDELAILRDKEVSPIYRNMIKISFWCIIAAMIHFIVGIFVYNSKVANLISLIIFFSAIGFFLSMQIPLAVATFRQHRRIRKYIKRNLEMS